MKILNPETIPSLKKKGMVSSFRICIQSLRLLSSYYYPPTESLANQLISQTMCFFQLWRLEAQRKTLYVLPVVAAVVVDVRRAHVSSSWPWSAGGPWMVLCRLDSCLPGTWVSLHMYYRGKDVDTAGSVCPGCLTYKSHTLSHCRQGHHPIKAKMYFVILLHQFLSLGLILRWNHSHMCVDPRTEVFFMIV